MKRNLLIQNLASTLPAALLLFLGSSCTKNKTAEEPYRNFWTIDNQVHGTMEAKYQHRPVVSTEYQFLDAQSGDSTYVVASIGGFTGEQAMTVVNEKDRPGDIRDLGGLVNIRAFRKGQSFVYTGPSGVAARTVILDTTIAGNALRYELLQLSTVRLENEYDRSQSLTLSGRMNLSRRVSPQIPTQLVVNSRVYAVASRWTSISCEWVLGYYAAEGSLVELRFNSRPTPGTRFRIGNTGCDAPEGNVDMRYKHDAETGWYRPSYDSAMLGREMIIEQKNGLMQVSLQGLGMKEPVRWESAVFQNGLLTFKPF